MNTLPAAFPLSSVGWMKLGNNYVGGESNRTKWGL